MNRNFTPIFILVFTILWAARPSTILASGPTASHAAVTVKASVSRESVDIADPFTLTIEVTAATSARVQLPQLLDEIGEFEVLDYRDQFGVPIDAESQRWVRTIELETLKTGRLQIPAMEVVVTIDRKASRLQTTPIIVKVKSALESNSNPKTFQDIRASVDAPLPNDDASKWLPWTTASLIGLVAIAGIILLFRKPKPRLTPQQWALAELENPQTASITHFNSTLRLFLEQEYGFPANSMSPSQIDHELADQDIDNDARQTIQQFFSGTQQIRFAGRSINSKQLSTWQSKLAETIQQLGNFTGAQK